MNGGGIDNCPEADMMEVGVEFAIAPYFYHSPRDPLLRQASFIKARNAGTGIKVHLRVTLEGLD